MTWWVAVLWLVVVLAAIPAFAVLGELADRAFQRRQDARLWKALKPWKG